MTWREAKQHWSIKLAPHFDDRTVMQMWKMTVEDAFQFAWVDVLINAEEQIPSKAEDQLAIIIKELQIGKPIQYVLGISHFGNLKLKVNESVLIPRPETEELVQWVLEENVANKEIVLDFGTGSGCIALSLAAQRNQWKVVAIDVSQKAIEIVKCNIDSNQIQIETQVSDVLLNASWLQWQDATIIVSNPPYIPIREKDQLSDNVTQYEPNIALFIPDNDPLLFYRTILENGKKLPRLHSFYFEIHENYHGELAQLLDQLKFRKYEFRNDMQGKVRMIKVTV